jgi:hypothetical protein
LADADARLYVVADASNHREHFFIGDEAAAVVELVGVDGLSEQVQVGDWSSIRGAVATVAFLQPVRHGVLAPEEHIL